MNCAKFVHLLPASENHHHCGAGGLLRHLLEVGAWSAQFSEGKVFAYGKPPEQRKHEEPRWTVAAFTAGLLHDIGKAATDMQITAPDGKIEWSPFIMPMSEWGELHNVERYFVRWRKDRHKKHEKVVPILANHVLPIELKDWLGSKYPEIIHAMLEAASYNYDRDEPRQSSVLADLVSMADRESTSRDRKMTESMGSSMAVGVPVDRHLMDAARRLYSDGTWKVNQKGGRIWHTKEGTFIAWKYAADEILALLAEDNILGIPRNKDTMADILVERGIGLKNDIENPANPRNYWSVHPEVIDTHKGPIWLQCLKLNSWDILSSSEPPVPPIKAFLKGDEGEVRVLGGAPEEQSPFVTYAQKDEDVPAAAQSPAPQSNKPSLKKTEKGPQAKSGFQMPNEKAESSESKLQGNKETLADKLKAPAPAPKPEPSPYAQAASESQKWLERHGSDASKILLKMFEEISLNIRGKDEIFGEEDGVVYLHHPRAAKQHGKPGEIIAMFMDAGWLIPDPENPARKARDMSEGRGLVMNAEVAEHIRNLLKGGSRKPQLDPIPQPEVKKPSHQPAPKKQAEQKQPQAQKPVQPKQAQAVTSENGRPPTPKAQILDEAVEIVNEFIEKVRDGTIPSTPKRDKDGVEWISVGSSNLTRFLTVECKSKIPPSMMINAFSQHEDCKHEGTRLVVKKA
jgi:conjugal transfer pilus assembly protein TraI